MEQLPPPREKELPPPNEELLNAPALPKNNGKSIIWLVLIFVLIIIFSASILLLPSQKTTTTVIPTGIPTSNTSAKPTQPLISTTPATNSPDVAAQILPTIQGTIKPDEIKKHTILIDKTIQTANFTLGQGGALELVLYTPSGTKIDSSNASNNPNINYKNDAMFKSYEIQSPQSGTWTIEITAVNIKNAQDYSVMIFTNTNLFVAAGTDKDSYIPNEPISVLGYVQNNGSPFPKANVTAIITKPDKTKSTIQLYDDGLHKDDKADDGIYANVFSNTNTSGAYDILITANGTMGGQSFERKGPKTVWVESNPDLAITSSDINFSNNTPVPGENITINATIHNTGIGDANGANIFFNDGAPASGGPLIAEVKINVGAGKTSIASTSWKATTGKHEIYVLVSPFNDFLEKNTTNNKAFKSIQTK